MEDIEKHNNGNEVMTILATLGGIFLLGFIIYYSIIKPASVKQKCQEIAQIETTDKFTDPILKDNKTLKNWFLNIRYKSCVAQHGMTP